MSVIYKRLNTCLHSSLTWLDSEMHASLPSQGKEEKNSVYVCQHEHEVWSLFAVKLLPQLKVGLLLTARTRAT
jgi:hypothetical protein